MVVRGVYARWAEVSFRLPVFGLGVMVLICWNSGSYTVVMAMASAYISDCVDEEKRNVQVGKSEKTAMNRSEWVLLMLFLGRIHGSMFIGIAAGPALSSAIVAGSGQESPLLVFYIGLVSCSGPSITVIADSLTDHARYLHYISHDLCCRELASGTQRAQKRLCAFFHKMATD